MEASCAEGSLVQRVTCEDVQRPEEDKEDIEDEGKLVDKGNGSQGLGDVIPILASVQRDPKAESRATRDSLRDMHACSHCSFWLKAL